MRERPALGCVSDEGPARRQTGSRLEPVRPEQEEDEQRTGHTERHMGSEKHDWD